MRCEDIRPDIEAYALSALEPDQAAAVETHVSECKDCAQYLRVYQVAVEHLALAVPLNRAPPRLKNRLLGAVGAPLVFAPPILRNRWVARAIAASLVVFAIGAIAWAVMLSAEVSKLRDDNQQFAELNDLDSEQRNALLRLQGDLFSARSQQNQLSTTLQEQAKLILLALDPDLVPTELQGTALSPNARCNYVWSGKEAVGALTCKDMSSMTSGQSYQLWATKGDKDLALGYFMARTDGTAQLLVKFPTDAPGPVTNFWVTLEQNQVVTRPSNQVVLEKVPPTELAREQP